MATLSIALPPQEEQTGFNLRRWAELLEDPTLTRVEGRIETDRHGHVIMSPPPAPGHGSLQARIASLLDQMMTSGRVFTECPISTADGVKAADVAWASVEQVRELGEGVCFSRAPEICVEVLSPSNRPTEIDEKKALYFDAGSKEVWVCSADGSLSFFSVEAAQPLSASRLCPTFPARVRWA